MTTELNQSTTIAANGILPSPPLDIPPLTDLDSLRMSKVVSLDTYRAERDQLKIRLAKLERLIAAWEAVEGETPSTGDTGKQDYRGRVRVVLAPGRGMGVSQIITALKDAGHPVETTDAY